MPKRFCVVALLLGVVACGAVPTFAQETPSALDFKVPMTLFIAGAALDDASTLYFMKHPAEGNPMLSFMRDKPNTMGRVAVLGDTLAVWAVQHFKGKHPKLVKTFLYTAASIHLSSGIRKLVTVNVLPLLPAR
jgi:hypothetical protein